MTRDQPAQPGDGGACPICGEDMAEKVYEESVPTISERELRVERRQFQGRYWHMKHEHAILEDYFPPQPPEGASAHR